MIVNIYKKLITIAIILLTLNTFAKDIYVAKNGNDSNSGTIESPYLTLSKAASIALPGDIVYIREGTYEETLSPKNSGTAGNPIIYQSYPGEKVIISAMQSLSGWTQDSGSIYKTKITFNSLGDQNFVMVNQTACDLARWPNKTNNNPFDIATIRNTGGSSGEIINNAYLTENTIPAINWTGGAIFFYGDKAGSGWTAWKKRITSSSSGRVNFDLEFGTNESWVRTFHAPKDLGDFYLEGVKEALDYKNEWYFDESSKELFIQLQGGTPPTDGEVKMRKRIETINLKNKSYIEIRNIAVFGGAINMEDSSTWQANGNNKTTNNVLYAVSSFYGNYTIGVSNSSRAGKASINIQGSNNTIEKCEIAFNTSAGIQARGNNIQIIDNYIHDFDFLSNYDAPLVARGINNSLIKNNTIFNGGRDCIQYYGTNNEIAYNDVSKSNLLADDCGLFYTVGAQYTTEIHHNWFHDTQSNGSKSKATAIYLDNDAAGFKVHHNVVWNTEWTNIQINWNGKDIEIYNNTLWNGSQVMGAWHKDGTSFSNVKVWNNLSNNGDWEPQSDKQNNLVVTANVFTDANNGKFTLKPESSPINQGRIITGITDGYIGTSPDIGAYEYGADNWVAGITWDPIYSPTGNGCYGLPGEDCIDFLPNDDDKDGVTNDIDLCPDTPLKTSVNTDGCPIFEIASDNFKILTKSETCISSNNGSITITSNNTTLNFSAKIEELNIEKSFTSNTSFTNLEAGSYTLCITTSANLDYKQCFNIIIYQPEKLIVTSKINSKNKQVSLTLNGSDTYNVTLNGSNIVTTKNILTLNLKDGNNKIEVKTAKECQGKYSENINLDNNITLFPNTVKTILSLNFLNNVNHTVNYKIISSTGQVYMQQNKFIKNKQFNLNLETLKPGLYFIQLKSQKINFQSKIIKQ
ncbi:hypothetical protein GCM10022291_00030 [Postechiella marina]|uniref:Uncharacterized protein n=1 Tax=Postechiella marina TaxID=943941 RepID=A0ABP8BY39_9FLAO